MWKLDYLIQGNCYVKAIVNDKKEIILIVDILSDQAIKNIIDTHNEALNKVIVKEYEQGLREGMEMAKNNKNKY